MNGVIGLLFMSCASTLTPKQLAERDCRYKVANEMGYDVEPNNVWRPRPGTQAHAGTPVHGAGVKIGECVKAKGY
jgi:hypothetical protein